MGKVFNQSLPKVDGPSLAAGEPLFVDDIANQFKDRLFGKMLTSPFAHAEILTINTSEAESLKGVHLVLTYKNTPKKYYTTAGQGYPEPSPYDNLMFDKKVRFVGDRVACVFAESENIAEEALKLIQVEYKELESVLDSEDSMREGAPIIHEEDPKGSFDSSLNIAAHVDITVGDVDNALLNSEVILEERFKTQYAQHTPIEPHVCFGYEDPNGKIVLYSSTQVPFHARRIVATILDLPFSKIRVIKPRIGGGFGTKQEVILEDLVALAVLRTKKPVEIKYTRKEEFISSRTRHPMRLDVSIGADKEGNFKALKMYILSNTGAYGSHSLTVLSNAGSKSLPFYNKATNVRFFGDAVYTNLPVAGAYRGYGATQGYFALESAVDDLAEKLNIDPLTLRKKNCIKIGEGSPIFEKLGEGREGVAQILMSSSLDELIDEGAKKIGWLEKRGKRNRTNYKVRGVGAATFMQGSGIPLIDMASVTIKMNEDGTFLLLVGATDLGTGSDTILAQIAAEVLGVGLEKFTVYSSDTEFTPFDVGAYASSTTFVSGGAVLKAAKKIRNQIFAFAAKILNEEFDKSLLLIDPAVEFENEIKDPALDYFEIQDSLVISKKTGKSVSLKDIGYHSLYYSDQKQLEVNASFVSPYSPPPFAAHFAEVEVDELTGHVEVIKYIAAVDPGIAVNPQLARGQVIGSVVNGIGYALCEEYKFSSKGAVLNPNLFDYKILSSKDINDIEVIIKETYEPTGPMGAKSIGEININGPLPAIRNAILDATGIKLFETPFTPEKVLKALKERKY